MHPQEREIKYLRAGCCSAFSFEGQIQRILFDILKPTGKLFFKGKS